MQKPPFVQQNIPLAPYTTLGVGGDAEYFAFVHTEKELHTAVMWAKENSLRVTPLGSGSNILVSNGCIEGLIVRPLFHGVTYDTREASVEVTVGAGEILDEVIEQCAEKGLWGLENMSGIPGTIGAMPIQNVGAYGVEAKDVVALVSAYNTETGIVEHLTNAECTFGYRDSLFKQTEGRKYIIVSVTLELSTTPKQILSYKDLTDYFSLKTKPNQHEIRKAVLFIRSAKFPDWHTVGTAGSFFKNPIMTRTAFEALVIQYPLLPSHSAPEDMVKVPLGYILDKICGLKGYQEGIVSLYEKQALVLVCERGTDADMLIQFSQKIISVVKEKTGLSVEREVTILKNK